MIGKIMGLVHFANYVSNCGKRFFAVYFIFVLFIFMYMKQYMSEPSLNTRVQMLDEFWNNLDMPKAETSRDLWTTLLQLSRPLTYSAPTLVTSDLICHKLSWPLTYSAPTLMTSDLICFNSRGLWPTVLQLSWPLTYSIIVMSFDLKLPIIADCILQNRTRCNVFTATWYICAVGPTHSTLVASGAVLHTIICDDKQVPTFFILAGAADRTLNRSSKSSPTDGAVFNAALDAHWSGILSVYELIHTGRDPQLC